MTFVFSQKCHFPNLWSKICLFSYHKSKQQFKKMKNFESCDQLGLQILNGETVLSKKCHFSKFMKIKLSYFPSIFRIIIPCWIFKLNSKLYFRFCSKPTISDVKVIPSWRQVESSEQGEELTESMKQEAKMVLQ